MCCLLTELPDIPAAKHPRRAAAFRSQAWSEWGWGGRGAGFPLGPGAGLPWAGQTQLRGGRQRATCYNVSPHPFFLGICQVQFPGREPFLLEGRVSGWKGPLAVSAPPAVPSLQGSRGRPCAHGTDQSEARRMHGCFLSSQKWLFSDKE